MESSGHYFGDALKMSILEAAHIKAYKRNCVARMPSIRFAADAHFYASRYCASHADNCWSL